MFSSRESKNLINISELYVVVCYNYYMMLWIVAAAIGILATVVLIYKYIRTSKYDILGFSMYCKVCGDKINGLKCPNCAQKKNDLR